MIFHLALHLALLHLALLVMLVSLRPDLHHLALHLRPLPCAKGIGRGQSSTTRVSRSGRSFGTLPGRA